MLFKAVIGNMDIIKITITIIILIISGISDIKYYKIPNFITFPGMIIGLLLSGFPVKTEGWVALGLLVLLFFVGMFRIMGMGDLKLIMALVAINGLSETSVIVLTGVLFLMVYCFVTDYRSMVLSLKNTFHFFVMNMPISKINDVQYPLGFFMALGYPIAFYIFHVR